MEQRDIQEINVFVENEQKRIFDMNHWRGGAYARLMPSAREIIASVGFAYAEKKGWLEPYKDSRGRNFKREKDAFEASWGDKIPNSEWFN